MAAVGSLTGVIDVATAVNIQSGRPTDREFMSLVSDFETKPVLVGSSRLSMYF